MLLTYTPVENGYLFYVAVGAILPMTKINVCSVKQSVIFELTKQSVYG